MATQPIIPFPKGYKIADPEALPPLPKGYAFSDHKAAGDESSQIDPAVMKQFVEAGQQEAREKMSMLPTAGALMAGGGGAGLGSAIQTGVENEFPKFFGGEQKSPEEAAFNVALNAGLGSSRVVPNIMAGLGRLGARALSMFPSVRGALQEGSPEYAKVVSNPLSNSDLLERLKNLPKDTYGSAALDYADTQQPEVAMQLREGATRKMPNGSIEELKKVPIEQIEGDPGNQIYEDTVKDYMKNGYSVHPRLVSNPEGGYTIHEGHHRILADVRNGATEVKAWTPQENPEAVSSIKDSLVNLAKETKGSAGGEENNPLVKYVGRHLLWRLSAGAGLAHLGGAAAGAGSLILTDAALGVAARNPVVREALKAAIKTPITHEASPLLQKIVMYNLRGTQLIYQDEDGNKTPVKIDDQGNPQPIRRQE